ncbi:transmembrane glyco NMB [Pelobates cultripes]|uniref:Transmembrane glyco NMB n=1 Tax=Pelobates cultripes TaxID=61616 RepID=A0AAD1RWH8_PELCU|nr:transmembrane glyco NMB [Pelobates cultripes]
MNYSEILLEIECMCFMHFYVAIVGAAAAMVSRGLFRGHHDSGGRAVMQTGEGLWAHMRESVLRTPAVTANIHCIPTDACTIISDSTCTIPQNEVCDEVVTTDECLVTLRRAFTGPGTYCVNITLGDDASLALASTLVSVSEGIGTPAPVKEILIYLGILAVIAVALGALLYKKYKGYKRIDTAYHNRTNEGLSVTFNQIKSSLLKRNDEHHPLLKTKAGVI